jgi:hypothetical protein
MATLSRDQWEKLLDALADLEAIDEGHQPHPDDTDCAAFVLASTGQIVRFGGFLAQALTNAGLGDFDRDLFYDDARTEIIDRGRVLLYFRSVTIAKGE